MVLDTEITKNKVSPEGKSLLQEIADQSMTEYVHVEPDKRYVLAALGRYSYVDRNGYDARITNKGLQVIGLPPVERANPDGDRVIVEALAKKRQPVRMPLPDDFGQSALSEAETPAATEPINEPDSSGQDAEAPAAAVRYVVDRVASTIVPVTEQMAARAEEMQAVADGAKRLARALTSTGATCAECGDCLTSRVLNAVMERLPEARDLFEAMRAEELILNRLDELGKR